MPLTDEARRELYVARIETARYDEAVDEVMQEVENHVRFHRYLPVTELPRRISSRVKELDRLEAKVDRGRKRPRIVRSLAELESVVTDIAGVRVVLDRLDQVNAAAEFVKQNQRWQVVKTEKKRREDTGYRAVHMDLMLSTTNHENVRCELQLRTLLQHAYALWTTPLYEYTRTGRSLPPFLLGQMCAISDNLQNADWRVNKLARKLREAIPLE